MLITPLPGADRTTLLDNLGTVHMDLLNVRGNGLKLADKFNAYLNWVSGAVRLLRWQVAESDLERLLMTRRYWTLQAMATGPVGMVGDLVDVEIDSRVTTLDDAIKRTRDEFQRWSQVQRLVVADTTVFCQHSSKLEEIDLAIEIECREEQIELVVPMAVVDELDGLKRSNKDHLRWRAGYTLAVLDRVAGLTGTGSLRAEDFSALEHGGIPRGEIRVDILFDMPGHTRLPINDDEIVDRALAVQVLSGKPVTFLTYDTGQAMRARAAGLGVVKKLSKALGAEPATGEKGRRSKSQA